MQPVKKHKEIEMPKDFVNALKSTPSVELLWKDLTPIARRDFVTWIEGAKQLETRARRIAVTRSKLLSGDRRPCCYAVVPMNLYKALGESKNAKATWKELSPDERRDCVEWIDEAKNKEERAVRIEKTCIALAKGKHAAV